MLEDARSLPAGFEIETDVCIVGAGAAGLAIARELDGSGLRVALIESGGLQADPLSESLNAPPADYRGDYPVATSRARYFGGATNLWSGVCLPLDAIEFEPRAWLPHSGWPITRAELEPFLERACAAFALGPLEYCTLDGYRRAYRHDPRVVENSDVVTMVMQICSPAHPARSWGEVLRRSHNVTTWLHATAVELRCDARGGRVERLQLACADGKRLSVSARRFVLATGGIENARLLLTSNLGNQHDLVGRYFSDHLALAPGFVETVDRAMSLDFYTRTIRRDRGSTCGVLALSEAARRRYELTAVKVRFYSFIEAELTPAVWVLRDLLTRRQRPSPMLLGRLLAGSGNVAAFLTWRGLRRFGIDIARRRLAYAEVSIEMQPDPNNRVTLSAERDALGQQRATVRLVQSERDGQQARRGLQIVEAALAQHGVSALMPFQTSRPLLETRYVHHQTGTTKMHDLPQHGVVDRDCCVHGIANLFVAGSSVFPTVASSNPTLTIVALAIRLADHLKRQHCC